MIEKLQQYKTSSKENPWMWIEHPDTEEIINKINEIIDYLNNIEGKGQSNEN